MLASPTIINSASHSNLHFDWPVAGKPSRSCQKMSQSCHKLCLVVTARCVALQWGGRGGGGWGGRGGGGLVWTTSFLNTLFLRGTQRAKIGKNALNAVYCFLVSFYGLLKGYLCELALFYLVGCGSWKFKWQKIIGNGILFHEFSSWYLPSENGSWAFIAPKTAASSSRK